MESPANSETEATNATEAAAAATTTTPITIAIEGAFEAATDSQEPLTMDAKELYITTTTTIETTNTTKATTNDKEQDEDEEQQKRPQSRSSRTSSAGSNASSWHDLHDPQKDCIETMAAPASSSSSPKKCNENVRKGKCKWFNAAKGWGFITPNDGGPDVFVHQSVIQMSGFRSLGEQEEVEYEIKETERGLEATRVTGRNGADCAGNGLPQGGLSHKKQKRRRVRCYNCGEFANHLAINCQLGPQPKLCHHCKESDHLVVDCPEKKVRDEQLENIVEHKNFVNNADEAKSHSKRCVIA